MLENIKTGQLQEIEDIVVCPYVSKHRIKSKYFLKHLNACRKRLSKKYLQKFQTCRYNILHIFPTHEIKSHEKVCPNRQFIKKIQFQLVDEKILIEEISKVSDQLTILEQEFDHVDKQRGVQLMNRDEIRNGKRLNESDFDRFCPLTTSYFLDCNKVLFDYQKQATLQKQQSELDMQEKIIIAQQDQSSKQEQETSEKKHSIPENEIKYPQNDAISQKKSIEKQMFIQQCQFCCSILKNPQAKLWRNKKLKKYLKMYEKLKEEDAFESSGVWLVDSGLKFCQIQKQKQRNRDEKSKKLIFEKKVLPEIYLDENSVVLEESRVVFGLNFNQRQKTRGNKERQPISLIGLKNRIQIL